MYGLGTLINTVAIVVGGLLGFRTDNEKIRESLRLAEFRGLSYEFFTADDPKLHPNTVLIEATSRDKTVRVQGASVGGGAIRITEINGMAVQIPFVEDTLILFHRDSPGVLASIAHILSSNGYNIGNLRLYNTEIFRVFEHGLHNRTVHHSVRLYSLGVNRRALAKIKSS